MTDMKSQRPTPLGTEDEILAAVASLSWPGVECDAPLRWPAVTAEWLSGQAPATRRAHLRSLATWLGWCSTAGIDPRAAHGADIDAYAASRHPDSPALATVAIMALRSWNSHLSAAGFTGQNPASQAARPTARTAPQPRVMTQEECDRVMAAAASASNRELPTYHRDLALLALMITSGRPIGEILGATVRDIVEVDGERFLQSTDKYDLVAHSPIPPWVGVLLEQHLAERAAASGVAPDTLTGPIFATQSGALTSRQTAATLFRRMVSQAGLEQVHSLSLHSHRRSAR